MEVVAKAGDLEDSKCTKIYGSLELTVGKLTAQTKLKVETYIEECLNVTKVVGDWKSYLMLSTSRVIKNESEDRPEPRELLRLIQQMAIMPPSTMPIHNKQSKNGNDEDQIVLTSSCWTCLLNHFGLKPKPNVSDKPSTQEASKFVKSIILGHSDDVVVNVKVFEVSEGKSPPFEIKISKESTADGGRYRGFYSWPRNDEIVPDHYYGEFSDGRFDGHGAVFYFDGGFYKGQWRKDVQSGFGVQRWRSGAVYLGQWEDNKEHGHGVHYRPPIAAPAWHASRRPYFSLFLGEFESGYPTYGVLLEGENVSDMTQDDVLMAANNNSLHSSTSTALSGPCRAYQVLFDGRSAFWQHPIPVEKTGEFEVRVKLCQYETRALVKSYFSSERIEDIWCKRSPSLVEKKGTGLPNLLSARHDDDGEESAAAMKQTRHNTTPHLRTESLYKIMKFRGTCVRNKSGYFPCPTVGILYDEDQKFEVEYNGKSLLSKFPTPIRVYGEYVCDVPSTDPSQIDSETIKLNEVERLLDELVKVKLIKQDLPPPYKIQFEGNFELESFASHGIILIGEKIFNVAFDHPINLRRVLRGKKGAGNGKDSEKKKDKTEPKQQLEEGVEDNADEYDIEEDSQIVDFDKLMDKLKNEKKLVEIGNPQATRRNQAVEILHPREAMKEALKVLSLELWSASGALRKRHKENSHEAIKETWEISTHEFEATNGALFHGWFRKVYCPKRGIGKFTANCEKHCDQSTEEVKNIMLDKCNFLPGKEEWIIYFLRKLKSSHLSNMTVQLAKYKEEIASIEAEISEIVTTMKKLKCTSTGDAFSVQDQPVLQDTITRQGAKKLFETAETNPISFLHFFLKNRIKEITMSGDGHIVQRKCSLMKSAKLRMDVLKESLVRKMLAKARCDEVFTDIQLGEAKSAIMATKSRADLAADKLEDALNCYKNAKIWNETEIKTRTAQFDAAKNYCSQCKEVLQQNPADASAKEELETAERAKYDAKIELEFAKRSAKLGIATTALSCCSFRLLELTVAVSNLEASVEAGMHQKSSARVFSELALLQQLQWRDEHCGISGGQATEAKYLARLALLKDEHKEMQTSSHDFSDDNLLDLYTWSKMMSGLVAAEQGLHSKWSKCAAEQSSITPNSPSLHVAEIHLETVMSEAKQVIKSYAQEHLTRKFKKHKTDENTLVKTVLANLRKGCSTSTISSVLKDLAEASLIIAHDRLENASNTHKNFPEIDSAEYLKRLDAAIEVFPQPR